MGLDKGATLGTGILSLVFGIIFLVFPSFTLAFFAVMMGIVFLFAGISLFVSWWRVQRGTTQGAASVVLGILCVVFALICLTHPLGTAQTLTWLVALCVVIASAAQLVALIATAGLPGRALGIVATVVILLFGIFALVWPPMVVQFLGISLIIEGLAAVILSALADPRP